MRRESGFRIAPNWPEIGKVLMTLQFADMTLWSNFFDVLLFLLSSLVTGPSFMSISSLILGLWQFSFISDWPEVGNTFVLVLPNIWILGQVRHTKFGMNVSNKTLLNAAKCQSYRNYSFWVIKGKPAGGVTPHIIFRFKLPTSTCYFVPTVSHCLNMVELWDQLSTYVYRIYCHTRRTVA